MIAHAELFTVAEVVNPLASLIKRFRRIWVYVLSNQIPHDPMAQIGGGR